MLPLVVIVCGMAGARQGWHEAAYAKVPCTPPGLPQAVKVPTRNPLLDVRILPGVAQDRPLTTFVLLGKEDSPVTSRVRAILSSLGLPFEDRVGGTSLGGLLDILRGLDGIVTVDTGVRHLGNLLGIPIVVIRHSQSSNVEWGPYGPRESVLTRPQPCSPCGLRPCKFETIRCMEAITSEEALEGIRTTIPGR